LTKTSPLHLNETQIDFLEKVQRRRELSELLPTLLMKRAPSRMASCCMSACACVC